MAAACCSYPPPPATRRSRTLRARAALTAAFQLPDDGDLTPGRRLFTALDEDGNGELDLEEFEVLLERFGIFEDLMYVAK